MKAEMTVMSVTQMHAGIQLEVYDTSQCWKRRCISATSISSELLTCKALTPHPSQLRMWPSTAISARPSSTPTSSRDADDPRTSIASPPLKPWPVPPSGTGKVQVRNLPHVEGDYWRTAVSPPLEIMQQRQCTPTQPLAISQTCLVYLQYMGSAETR